MNPSVFSGTCLRKTRRDPQFSQTGNSRYKSARQRYIVDFEVAMRDFRNQPDFQNPLIFNPKRLIHLRLRDQSQVRDRSDCSIPKRMYQLRSSSLRACDRESRSGGEGLTCEETRNEDRSLGCRVSGEVCLTGGQVVPPDDLIGDLEIICSRCQLRWLSSQVIPPR